MKKTLLVTTDYPPTHGGIAEYYAGLVDVMPKDSIVVLAPPLLKQWRLWPHWLPFLWRIRRAVNEYSIEHIWVGQVLPIGTAVWLLRTLGFIRVPYTIFTHGMDILTPKKGTRKHGMMMRVLSGAVRVIANSAFTKRALMDLGVSAAHIVVVRPGITGRTEEVIHPDTLRQRYRIVGKRVLLTTARLVRRKGVDIVLDALKKIATEDVVYVVVGDGPEKYKLEVAAARDFLPVIFTGAVSRAELEAWYDVCDVFIMTPRNINGDVEGFGMVYLEANLHGKPVIATRTGGVPEAVVHDQTGLLVPEDDVDATAAAMQHLLTDTIMRIHLGEQGLHRARSQFSWRITAQALL